MAQHVLKQVSCDLKHASHLYLLHVALYTIALEPTFRSEEPFL